MKAKLLLIWLFLAISSVCTYSSYLFTFKVVDEDNKPIHNIGATIGNSKVIANSNKDGIIDIYANFGDTLKIFSSNYERKIIELFPQKKMLEIVLEKSKIKSTGKSDTTILYHSSTAYSITEDSRAIGESSHTESIGRNDPNEPFFDGEIDTEVKAVPIKSAKMMAVKRDSESSFKEAELKVGSPEGMAPKRIDYAGYQNAESGKLTAGEVNDFSKWNLWNDIANDVLKQYKDNWKIYPIERFVLQLENSNGNPVIGANVELKNSDNVVWKTVTDNTGKAELWANAYSNLNFDDNYSIEINFDFNNYSISNAKKFNQGINYFKIDTDCDVPNKVDIAFVVDATGSMQDEIDYLKADLLDIINSVKDTLPQLDLNLGCVFYKDTSDEYISDYYNLNNDPSSTVDFIKNHNAGGGEDNPEAVHRAIDVSVNYLSWRKNTIAKIVFLVLDAPPHDDKEHIAELQISIAKAAEKGIRIIPVACSGVDKSTEYILRSIALLTNGTYTFLTDHSGIGNAHIEPTTDKYKVEKLNDIIKRIIIQYTNVPSCNSNAIAGLRDTGVVVNPKIDTVASSNNNTVVFHSLKFYPNPTERFINIELTGNPEELFIADVSGKLVKQVQINEQSLLALDMSEFPSGTYFVMYQYAVDKWAKGRFLLMK